MVKIRVLNPVLNHVQLSEIQIRQYPFKKWHLAIPIDVEGLWEDDIKACRRTTDQALTSASLTHMSPFSIHHTIWTSMWLHQAGLYIIKYVCLSKRYRYFSFFSLSNGSMCVTYPTAFRYKLIGLFSSKFQFWSVTMIKIYMFAGILQTIIINCI